MALKTSRMASPATLLLFLAAAAFQVCFSAAATPASAASFGSSLVFPLQGNVYPLGYYSVHMSIGQPPKLYDLDIDTGSDLTWVQCDAPCTGCTKPRSSLYRPGNNLVLCRDPLCDAVRLPGNQPCSTPNDQCDYELQYADSGSSLGVIVNDYFPLRFTNGSAFKPRLAFGCGYDQTFSGQNPPSTAGVLGLGASKGSILSQLHGMALTRNVVGHCLSRQGGFLYFGDDLVPSSGIVWTPMSSNSLGKQYSSGPAEVFFNGKTSGVKGLNMVFDSGSSYTYLSSKPYQAILNLIRKNINGKSLTDAREDRTLPVCWKAAKPVKSIREVRDYFRPLALVFSKNAQLQISPESYLVVTKYGNVCLGILNGSEVGLGSLNIIGDIFMQDKMVIYDNEKHQIGWATANCNRLNKY